MRKICFWTVLTTILMALALCVTVAITVLLNAFIEWQFSWPSEWTRSARVLLLLPSLFVGFVCAITAVNEEV